MRRLTGLFTNYEYGYFNETEADKDYYKRLYKNYGRKNIKVKRVASDTKGLKMYEITYDIV